MEISTTSTRICIHAALSQAAYRIRCVLSMIFYFFLLSAATYLGNGGAARLYHDGIIVVGSEGSDPQKPGTLGPSEHPS
ncbi:uncharacterized protein BDV17DRAFT_93117 [Aspergillus undulatus]|uniref:uncharacterized protein n=1 Tax=Aspergillus undulatus TaxID=1810928 RepID=UPI003CCD27B5